MNTQITLRSLFSKLGFSLKAQQGFTIFDTMMASIIGITVLAGSWIAFGNYSMEARIANADRQMDQYGTSAMKEVVNLLSDAWGAEQVRGGRSPLWRFYVGDSIGEFGQKWTEKEYNIFTTQSLHYVFFSHNAGQGILVNYNTPSWAEDGRTNYYVWRGKNPRRGTSAFDRRDGMTMTGLALERPESRWTGPCQGSESNEYECLSRLTVEITLQYRFSPPFANLAAFTGLFQDQYLHERSYKTTVLMRNWDVENSPMRDYVSARY